MSDYPFERAELAEDYIPLSTAEAEQLSRTVADVKSLRGIGAEGLSVVTSMYLKAKGDEPACFEWFHAEITTRVTAKHFGLKYDGGRKILNDTLPMSEYEVRWYIVREL